MLHNRDDGEFVSARIKVAPAVLRWAREQRGLDRSTAATAIGVTEERLASWEEGTSYPTTKQVRKAAEKYRRPIGVFFLSEPPEPEELVPDFRRVPTAESVQDLSPALLLEIRLAQERRAEAIELSALIGEQPPAIGLTATIDSEPEALAGRIRRLLGVSLDDQARWPDARRAFNAWRGALEGLGVLVFQTGGDQVHKVEVEEARGFAIADQPYPVVAPNGSDSETARCFTLLHEFTHVVLRQSALCDQHERRSPTTSDRVEAFCNRISASVLIPRDALLEARQVRTVSGSAHEWSDEELQAIAKQFRVSREAVLRRLVSVGRSTVTYYNSWREQQPPFVPQTEGGLLLPPDKVIKRNGRAYSRLVLRAYEAGHIPLTDVVDLLEVGPQHVSAIESKTLGTGS